MSESAESKMTPEALRARAEMLVTVSENTRLPLSGNGSPELKAAIAGVQAERAEPEVALDQVLFELRGPDGHVWTLTLDGRCTGFPAGTTMRNLALPLTLALIGKMKLQGAALAAQASNSVEAARPEVVEMGQSAKSGLYEAMQAASVVVQAPVVDTQGNHLYIGGDHAVPNFRGRTVMLHLHHPALADGQLKPVLKDALRAYLARMDEPGFNPPSLESTLLQSGAILSVVALPPNPIA